MKILKILAVVAGILVVGFFGIGLAFPTLTVDYTFTIDKPVDHTWKVFTDVARMPEWMDDLQEVQNLAGNHLEVGSRWKLVFLQKGETIEVIEEVTACKPPELYAFDMETEPFTGATEIRLRAEGAKTEFTATSTFSGRNLVWRSILGVMKGTMADQMQVSYEKLKSVVEATD